MARFYHVASRSHLPGIALHGLRSGDEAGYTNHAYPRMAGCVYLWPTLGAAAIYAQEDIQQFGQGHHVILAIDLDEDAQLLPDQEEFTRLLDEDEGIDCRELWDEVRLACAELGYDPEQIFQDDDYDAAIAIIEELPVEMVRRCAWSLADQGEAVAVHEPIDPGRLHVCERQDFEELADRFAEEHPELDSDQEDYYEIFGEWREGKPAISAEGLRELVEGSEPTIFVDHDIDKFFSSEPLPKWLARHGMVAPELEPVDALAGKAAIPTDPARPDLAI